MKRFACILMTATLLVALTACGEPEATEASSKAPTQSDVQSDSAVQPAAKDTVYTWGEAQVGMSYDEIIAKLGENTPQAMQDKTVICYTYQNVHALKEGDVVFVFDAAKKLEQIQYIVKEEHKVSYDETVSFLQKAYGTPAVLEDGEKTTVWKFKNGYLEVTEMAEGDGLYSVTFYAAAYYEQTFPDGAAACK